MTLSQCVCVYNNKPICQTVETFLEYSGNSVRVLEFRVTTNTSAPNLHDFLLIDQNAVRSSKTDNIISSKIKNQFRST